MSGDASKDPTLQTQLIKNLPLISKDDFRNGDERSKVCTSAIKTTNKLDPAAALLQKASETAILNATVSKATSLVINDKRYQVPAVDVLTDSESGEDSCSTDSDNDDDDITEEVASTSAATNNTQVNAAITRKPSTDLRDVCDKALGKKTGLKIKKKIKPKEKDKDNKDKEKDKDKDKDKDAIAIKKRKRRRPNLTICTSNCRYDVIRRTAAKFGLREVGEDDLWNLYWTDLSITVERAKDMKRFQKINHFPGMLEICRKDLLARNLNRMVKLYPKEYNIFPKTWCLPADLSDAMTYSRNHKYRTYILKPDTGSQGRGIYLTKNLKDIKPYDRMICQLYISRPLLLDGYKFDLRVYALITSCDPLRMYVYEDGLVRFATSRYKEPCGHNTTNVFMHLTNYAVNKHSRTYVVDSENGSKRKISCLNRDLTSRGIDLKTLWLNIDDVIVKTVISAVPILKHSYNACFKAHDYAQACFEILGFDVLIDAKLKPYVLEVNHSPSFHTDSLIDREIKESLLYDTFNLLNLTSCDKRRIMEEDRKRVRDRLLQGINKDAPKEQPENTANKKDIAEMCVAQAKWEDSHIGGYRRVYPPPPGSGIADRFEKFFNQTEGSSLFGTTVSHRVRVECSRAQREEIENKARAEAAKCLGPKSKSSLTADNVSTTTGNASLVSGKNNRSDSPTSATEKTARNFRTAARRTRLSTKGKSTSGTSKAFEPEPIIDSEERERLGQLAQRDFLVRSYGLVEQIYLALQKMGNLRQNDERKYGMYARAQQQQELLSDQLEQPMIPSSGVAVVPQTARSAIVAATKHKKSNTLSPASTKVMSSRVQNAAALRAKHNASLKASMSLQCNELPMYVKKWPDIDGGSSNIAADKSKNLSSAPSVPQATRNDSVMDINKVYQKIRANSKRYTT